MYSIKHLLQCSNLTDIDIQLPEFYKTCLNAWSQLLRKNNIEGVGGILDQNLFGNHMVAIKNKPLYLKHWSSSKICKIKDIWNKETHVWKSGTEIYTQLNNKRNWIAEYNKIKKLFH